MEMIIGLISGAIGGNAAGGLFKNLNQGVLINSLAGIVGGGLGGTILSALGVGGMEGAAGAMGSFDVGSILTQVAGGGVGGGVVLAIVGMIRNKITG
ncbi:hypothetical protein [uncultured Pelagimonas sp.]|uniref:hypothetical protein n=1 Tax=uncultured Pelagimonas sp. TaxID=1618102 RepID=UPI0026143148|nr:hypothetical protein [uncultured Pelagimonas sp.]